MAHVSSSRRRFHEVREVHTPRAPWPLVLLISVACGDPGRSPAGFVLEEVPLRPGIAATTAVLFVPGTTDELLILSKVGTVHHFRLSEDPLEATELGSFEVEGVNSDTDCGLISAAFDPNYLENRYLFIGYCTSVTASRIGRFVFDPPHYGKVASSAQLIFEAAEPKAQQAWHAVGSIGFEPDGTLWALFGDKTISQNAQNPNNELGALLRMIPERQANLGGAQGAPDNPFAQGGGSPFVYAWGLRSPWTGGRDSVGRYWVGDVGLDSVEEVNLVTEVGQNFGWPRTEGPCTSNCEGLVDPILSYDRRIEHPYVADDPAASGSFLRSVWVSPPYAPPSEEADPYRGALNGYAFFGDFCVGFVRRAKVNDAGEVEEDEAFLHLDTSLPWITGPDGLLYAGTFGSCVDRAPPPSPLYRLVPDGIIAE